MPVNRDLFSHVLGGGGGGVRLIESRGEGNTEGAICMHREL